MGYFLRSSSSEINDACAINEMSWQLSFHTLQFIGTLNNQDEIDSMERFGVYELKCNDCKAEYRGQDADLSTQN